MSLTTWTIYDHPSDYPDAFIARQWQVVDGEAYATGRTMTSPMIDVLRSFLEQQGLVALTRSPEDDPVIVETWL